MNDTLLHLMPGLRKTHIPGTSILRKSVERQRSFQTINEKEFVSCTEITLLVATNKLRKQT